jgi:phosphomannomutase
MNNVTNQELKSIKISDLMLKSGVQFGTSGVRGRVVDMTDEVCWLYTTAFLQYLSKNASLKPGTSIGIAGDLRDSTDRIMNAVAIAISDLGFVPVNYGKIPSPALALYGLFTSIPTIMVTGSHIPDDRNGIKFNKADGEILKADEQGIRREVVKIPPWRFSPDGSIVAASCLPEVKRGAERHYIRRFLDFFPKHSLKGIRIGLYEHSSVARESLGIILAGLGAEVISLGRSESFVSVDTEAIRSEDVLLAKRWSEEYGFDCIISTDGDGDRPLISDENGNWLRGDVAGILCAQYLGIDVVVTPVSSNSAVEKSGLFKKVIRTRIGSPYVIEAMEQAEAGADRVAGYEANGGFLQGSSVTRRNATLSPLPTRDAAIVPLCILMLAQEKQTTISGLLAALPARYTVSDRLKAFPTELSQAVLAQMVSGELENDLAKVKELFGMLAGRPVSINTTDGVRIAFDSDEIIHLRPSGNAPELRCYNEAASEGRAKELNATCMEIMEQWRR